MDVIHFGSRNRVSSNDRMLDANREAQCSNFAPRRGRAQAYSGVMCQGVAVSAIYEYSHASDGKLKGQLARRVVFTVFTSPSLD